MHVEFIGRYLKRHAIMRWPIRLGHEKSSRVA